MVTENKPAIMDVEKVLHMKEGLGETSYAQNSSLQKKSMEMLKHIITKSATDFYISRTPQTLLIADLGCSSGPNTLLIVGSIINEINKTCIKTSNPLPNFMVFLNDLPTNDFNTIFIKVPEFVKKVADNFTGSSVFVAGVPGSFYGRLFPDNSLHFISSCYSLHWLSQVPKGLVDGEGKPLNKGKIYISHTSPTSVVESYFNQFEKDFTLFLKSRSQELAQGGTVVLAMLGRKTSDHYEKSTCFLWELLAQSFAIMVTQELVQQEKVDSYNAPFYAASKEEIEDAVKKEGSFAIDHIEVFEMNMSTGNVKKDATITSMAIRAIQESMITHHFGEGIVDILFEHFKELLGEAMAQEEVNGGHLAVVLRKLN